MMPVPSGSSIDFTFIGTKAEVTLLGDNVTTATWGENSRPRVAIYVNDELVVDERLTKAKQTFTVFGIESITVTSTDGIKPTNSHSRKIEFIGDSITCGYGADWHASEVTHTKAAHKLVSKIEEVMSW